MSEDAPYRGNGPTGGMKGKVEESEDLKAIRRDREIHRLVQESWQDLYPAGDSFRRDFEAVAIAAQDWDAATSLERFRALRILVKRFGRLDTLTLTLLAATKSMQDWTLSVRRRKRSEKSDGGKRDREFEREFLAQKIGREVYQRMAAGQSKSEAIEAVKYDYRTGAPYPQIGSFPVFYRPKLNLPDMDGIEKLLAIFRRNARMRGYVDPSAPYSLGVLREPDLRLSDIPTRGRPPKK
ncbi:hypothetical protein GCM10023208_00230 [Erythrobacter westpacificensis]|uniref:Uncharacterized protein n=2 Tax=Erythrobacter westpacificensis TaxID=1055231 RepID=A0ABP9JVB8_9SPHN